MKAQGSLSITAGSVLVAIMTMCKIATLNISTLDNFGAHETTDLLVKHDIDILCLQECRMTMHSKPQYELLFSRFGYQLFPGPFDADQAGRPYGGVAMISKWPISKTDMPAVPEDETHPINGLEKRFKLSRFTDRGTRRCC